MMPDTYSLTTTLPYVNAEAHIGHALEFIQADALCRFMRMMGKEVVFNTGTDEHGLKIYRKAVEAGVSPKEYCDAYAEKFRELKALLNLSYTHFIRTTDPQHISAAQEFWKRCKAAGDIYKKMYEVNYCVGCELEKTDSELVDGKCPIHPTTPIERIQEENYFFNFSKYQKPLLEFYAKHPNFVVPETRFNEIKSFVEGGLQDFSISRLKEKMPWGIAVPDDADHVMYVWFDALINYISTLGWPDPQSRWDQFWPSVQVAGKDNLRQQSAMWQAMLMSAGVPNSKQIFIHGFITSGGQKMSKSLGNVVDPKQLVAGYGIDATRHYLLGGLPSYHDGDFGQQLFEQWYGSRLANGIGNLLARTTTMVGKFCGGSLPVAADDRFDTGAFWKGYADALAAYRFDEAVRLTDQLVAACDGAIDSEKPWAMAKEGKDVGPLLYQLCEALRHLGLALYPMIPDAATKVLACLGVDIGCIKPLAEEQKWGGLQPGAKIEIAPPLFPRIDQGKSS